MNAITHIEIEEEALWDEYKLALREWAAARAADPLNSQAPAVVEATKRIEELEGKLKDRPIERRSCLCVSEIPVRRR